MVSLLGHRRELLISQIHDILDTRVNETFRAECRRGGPDHFVGFGGGMKMPNATVPCSLFVSSMPVTARRNLWCTKHRGEG